MATAAAGPGDAVLLWALPSGRRLGPPVRNGIIDHVTDLSFSPDGRTLAITQPSLGIEIVDLAARRHRWWLRTQSGRAFFVARFTPDGRYLVGGKPDGSAQLWSTRTWRPADRLLGGHTGDVLWQSTSPDGHTLATGGTDGTIRLFDLRTRRPLGTALPGLPNRPLAPLFTPDGAHLFAITDAGRAYRWDVRPAAWARHACAVAGRTLTRAEWNDVLPDRDYAPACSG